MILIPARGAHPSLGLSIDNKLYCVCVSTDLSGQLYDLTCCTSRVNEELLRHGFRRSMLAQTNLLLPILSYYLCSWSRRESGRNMSEVEKSTHWKTKEKLENAKLQMKTEEHKWHK